VAMGQAMGSQQWELQRGGGLLQPAWTLTLWPEASINRTSPGTGGSTGALLRVPLEANGDLALAWQRQPEAWFSLSAADVLAGRVPKGMLSGAWVVVGGSAFGLNDRIATPLQSAAAGFVAHAQLLANLLDGAVPQRPHSQTFLEAGLALLVFGLLSLAAIWSTKGRRSSPAHAAATSPSSVAAIPAWLIPASLLLPLLFIGLHFALLRQGVLVGWIAPASGVALAGFVLGAWAQARSRLERERLYSHLSSYLPARVAQVLVGRSPSDRIDARAEEAVVLFADIRNFSAYCETRPPAEAAAVLHAFYTTAQHTVQAHGGTLEALQGDSIIAVWAVEDTRASQSAASAAIAAAVQMLRSVAGALPDPAPAGLEPLALGIGIECGPCMSGSIGPADRRTHLVMGRTVTVAGRLVEMTAELAHPILLGEGMAARLSGTLGTRSLRSLGTFMLEGLRVPHHIYAWLEEGAGLPSRGGLHVGGQPSVAATAPDRPPVSSNPEGPPASPLH
jgi:adenylate cyclase